MPNPPCWRITDVLSSVVIAIVPCGVRRSATDTLLGHTVGLSMVFFSRAQTRGAALRTAHGRPFPVRCYTPCPYCRLCLLRPLRSLNDVMVWLCLYGVARGYFDTGYVVVCIPLSLSDWLFLPFFLLHCEKKFCDCTARRLSCSMNPIGPPPKDEFTA